MRIHFSYTKTHGCRPKQTRQAGFSLLEVLIALLVLAIGLLGLAALQNMGLRLNSQSYERTQATILIDDMIDRMRANPAGVKAGNYNALVPTLTSTPPAAAQNCEATVCSSAGAVASYDVNRWITAIAGTGTQRAALAGGTGRITAAAPGPTGAVLFNISVGWQEQNQPSNVQTVTVQLP